MNLFDIANVSNDCNILH